jgi:hypothetical protein
MSVDIGSPLRIEDDAARTHFLCRHRNEVNNARAWRQQAKDIAVFNAKPDLARAI